MALDSEIAVAKQNKPTGHGTEITPLVCEDLMRRSKMGEAKYGTVLRADNGRNPLVDAYQETLDHACYLRQAMEEESEAQRIVRELRDLWKPTADLSEMANGTIRLLFGETNAWSDAAEKAEKEARDKGLQHPAG